MAAALLGLLVEGCAPSSPRFRTGGNESTSAVADDDESLYAAKIKSEEAREDDRKVDLDALKREVAQKRKTSFRYGNQTPPGVNRDAVLLDVVGLLGVPYKYGGASRQGMDCSGFTSVVYSSGLSRTLPRSTREQYGMGLDVSQDELQFGDLVFFNTTGRRPSHVGIYLEDDLFAHASISYGVTISSLESTYYQKRYVGARRVIASGLGSD